MTIQSYSLIDITFPESVRVNASQSDAIYESLRDQLSVEENLSDLDESSSCLFVVAYQETDEILSAVKAGIRSAAVSASFVEVAIGDGELESIYNSTHVPRYAGRLDL